MLSLKMSLRNSSLANKVKSVALLPVGSGGSAEPEAIGRESEQLAATV